MSTWKSENSLLTQQGIEILNKVKAGIGSITITRVVAGSGRVSASKLFTQTSISGTTKPMVITQKYVRDTGSEISVYITNADFTESFDLNQIGIFVSHKDYEGEVLYHISQCEEDGFDVIPALDETPANFGYNIFLEHGNSSSITINVDPQGAVSVRQFTEFTEQLSPNRVVSTDENGNLQDAGKSVSELCNPNLLTNAYFLAPVNRKNGYVVPPNTPYYSDTTLSTQVGTTQSYTRVTKVNDSYGFIQADNTFRYVEWSKALKGYANTGIIIDRWKLVNHTNSCVLLEDTGLKIKNNGTRVEYIQSNSMFNHTHFIGRKFTLSVLTADGQLFVTTSTNYAGNEVWDISSVSLDGAQVAISSNGAEFFGVQISIEPNKEVTIQAIKLEFGTQQTLAHQDSNGNWILNEIPNFADEMAKCAQYSISSDNYLGGTPYGYVDGEISNVQSAEDLDFRLTNVFNSMTDGTARFIRVTFQVGHPVLGGGDRLFEVFKANTNYGFVRATSYSNNNNGVVLEHFRSYANKVWTDWARTYTTYNKPTLTELGAAPHGLVYDHKVISQVSEFSTTLLGWFNTMGVSQTRNFVLNISVSGTPLEAGIWSITVNKVGDNLGTILAIKYQADTNIGGAAFWVCSVYNKSLTNWRSLSFSGTVPATLE